MPLPDPLSAAPTGDRPEPTVTIDGGTRGDRRPRRRWGTAAGTLTTASSIALVVISTESASVPVAVSGTGAGMSSSMAMASGKLALHMTDAHGRPVRVPAGRPGVFVVATAHAVACVCRLRGRRSARCNGRRRTRS